MSDYSDQDKLGELQREIRMRQTVYPLQIRKGLMTPHQAERQISILKEIRDEYRAKVQPSLFTRGIEEGEFEE